MNIGLDARTIFSPKPRGTGRNLFDAYRLIPTFRPDWRFTLYHQRPADACPLVADTNWPANVRCVRLNMPGDRLDAWFQFRLPLAAWNDRVDLLHVPANAAPAWCPVPLVATIHDLIPLKIPAALAPSNRRRFTRGVHRAVRQARHIITPSAATRADLLEHCAARRERITIIPWAPDHTISRVGSADRDAGMLDNVRSRYQLNRPWLLHFSGTDPRKNATGLIDALSRVAPESRRCHLWLFLGCDSPQRRAELRARIQARGVAADCRVLEFAPHEDLPGLLAGARALLMPSLYEGFGLPILDAFACGVPVLTSRCSSMPEIAGDAAVYCDPHSAESIAAAIGQILDPDVATQLIRRGQERVRDFSWERTASAMCAVYERCLARTQPARSALPGEVTCR